MQNTKKSTTRLKETEKDIQTAIINYLHIKKIYCWRNNTTSFYDVKRGTYRSNVTFKGVSDILGCYKGKFLAIEVKRPGGKPSPEQVDFIDNINKNGGLAFIAYSVDDVIKRCG